MDKREAVLRDKPIRIPLQFTDVLAGQDHLCPVALSVGDLVERGTLGHDDRGCDAKPGGMISDGLGVVSGGDGDDAALAFVLAKRQQF